MSDKEKIEYFYQNIFDIFNHHSNQLVSFVLEPVHTDDLFHCMNDWPDEIKLIAFSLHPTGRPPNPLISQQPIKALLHPFKPYMYLPMTILTLVLLLHLDI